MGPQRFEVESEAWYRAIAEGRLTPVSDHAQKWTPTPDPNPLGSAGYGVTGYGFAGSMVGTSS